MAEADGKLHLIQLAGGQGSRARGTSGVPKQFRQTARGLLFAVSLQEFFKLEPAGLVVVVPDAWRDATAAVLDALGMVYALAPPGDSRTASTWQAVQALAERFAPAADDLVAVHDAARPFASADLLQRLCRAAQTTGGAIPGVMVPDTIVETGELGTRYLERPALRAVQTPQVFRWDIFHASHRAASRQGLDFTDDGGLLASQGHHPAVVPGEPGNWKVTTADDWRQAEIILSEPLI